MARYLALPNELKDLIPLSTQDIARLSQTSKAMRAALAPRLFRRIEMHWEALESPPPISGVVMAILKSPDIAESVEELDFRGANYGKKVHNPSSNSCTEGIPIHFCEKYPKVDQDLLGCRNLLEEAMSDMGLSQDQWKWILGSKDVLDFVIAAIIVNCPNLKILRLESAFLRKNGFLSWILIHYLGFITGNSPTVLRKLQKVYFAQDVKWCSHGQTTMRVPLAFYLLFFYLPSLETFSVPLPDRPKSNLFPVGRVAYLSWPYETVPLCAVRRLDLHHTSAKPSALLFLLPQTPLLKSLKYDHWYYKPESQTPLFDCIELRDSLEFVSNTLEELIISIEPYDDLPCQTNEWPWWMKDDKGLYSLAFLSRLTKLEISLPVLLGWAQDTGLGLEDVLPHTLEDFCIRDDFLETWGMIWEPENTTAKIRGWLETKAWEKSTPNIKRFGLRILNSDAEWHLQARNTVVEICEAEGLQCWYEKLHADLVPDEVTGGNKTDRSALRYP